MLRENDINDFDLKVRSELENASLNAPRGVWRRVRREIQGAAGAGAAAGARGILGTARGILGTGHGILGTGHGSRGNSGYRGWVLAAACCCLVLTLGLWRPWTNRGVVPGVSVIPGAAGDEMAQNVPERVISAAAGDETAQNVPEKTDVRKTDTAGTPEQESESAPDILESLRRQDILAEEGRGKAGSRNSFSGNGNRRTAVFASGNLASNNTTSPAASWLGAQGEGSGALVKTGEETFGVPVEFGVGIKIPVVGRLSAGTGLSGSFLSSYYGASYDLCTGDVRHNMFYLGVPVNFYFNLVEAQSLTVYASAGGAAEYCISNKYIFHADGGTVLPHIASTEKFTRTISEPVKGFLFSVGAGIGVEFKINDLIGVYADPSFRYYFNSGHPTSVRTQRPQTFNFEAGIRFNL